MSQKTIAIAAVLAAVMLAAVFDTTPLAYVEDSSRDSSETETEVSVKEKATASGEPIADNCGYVNFETGSPR